jgi:hypothetical protein
LPWAKFSDTAAHHPVVLAPMAFDDWLPPRLTQLDLVNLLAGIFERVAVQSAGYTTDYVISAGVLASTAGDNWRHWANLMIRAGYLSEDTADGQPIWRLVDDPTNLVHLRLKDELDWERQRRRDVATDALIVPVRLRDGDACRYCGVPVVWGDQKGNRGATYDHRVPGKGAGGPDDLRVACRACNSRRNNHPDADVWLPPRPAPAEPMYGPKTRALLREHGYTVPATARRRPGTQPDTATTPGDPAASGTTPAPDTAAAEAPAGDPATSRTPPNPPEATRPPAGHRRTRPRRTRDTATANTATPPNAGHRDTPPARPGDPPDTAPEQPKHPPPHRSADPADRRSTGSGLAGTGRDGTGAPPSPPTTDRKRRRARRGRGHRAIPPRRDQEP